MRLVLTFFLWSGIQVLTAQSLPPYLTDTYPAANATGVPTNVNIILRANASLQVPPFAAPGYYTLKSGSSAAVSLTSPSNCYCFGTVLAPSAPLSPNTLYTFTVNPGSSVGPAFSFSFTTGAGPENTPPHLLSTAPPSGTTGLALNGPVQFHFDKRISRLIQQNQALSVRALPNYLYGYFPSNTLSSDGTTVVVTLNVPQGYPVGYEITIDPSQFVDAFGNIGQGAPALASYTTFIPTDISGPHLQASLPASGDTGVPTNVIPRLVFDKPVDPSTLADGIQLQLGGVAQSVTFNIVSNGAGPVVVTPAKPLLTNQTYTIALGTALRDQSGLRLQQAQSITFTTGPGPDLITPTVLATSPYAAAYPPNAQILIKTNKPIAPIVVARMSAAGLNTGQQNNIPVPASATLSSDGTLLALTPQAPLGAQYYSIATSELVDTSGAAFFGPGSSTISFNISGAAASTPPKVLAVNPPPDSTDVPLTAVIQLVFSEPCATCLFPNAITVSANGSVLPVKPTADSDSGNTSFTIKPSLSASITYSVSLTGIVDLAGNAMPDYSFSFTTDGSGNTPLKLISSSVNNGDTNVNPAGPFTFQYDSVLNPAIAVSTATIYGPSSFIYPAVGSASGSTLTVTPVNPLPANTTFVLVVSPNSIGGAAVLTRVTFTTAPASDTTRPQVTSISPADGSTLAQGSIPIVLTFSKPLDPSTVVASSIAFYVDGYASNTQPVRSADNRSVTINGPNVLADSFSVVASSAIRDLEGNPLVPFEASYQIQPNTRPPGTTFIHEMRPAFGSTNVPANTTITWFLDQRVDLAAIQANLVVIANSSAVAGTYDLAGDGRVLRFTPTNPFPAGSSVSFYERTIILGINNYGYPSFTIAPQPTTSLQYVRSTLGFSDAIDSVLEIEFNQDPPPGVTIASLTYSPGNGSSRNVAFTESRPRPHVLRLNTTEPRQPGYYFITFANILVGDVNSPRGVGTTLTATPLGGTPTVVSAGPSPFSTDVPVNTSPRILFGATINPLSVTAQSLTLSANSSIVTTRISYTANNREIIVRPAQALPPNAPVKVLLSGLQDMAGNPIPDYSWSFTTAAGPDFVGPSLLYTSLPAAQTNGGVEIAANEAIQLVFSKPIDPGIALLIGFGSGWLDNAAAITVSPDLRVVTMTPTPAWALGRHYSFDFSYFSDLQDNGEVSSSGDAYSRFFTVAFAASTSPPQLLAVSPPDGSTAMPLNARIMLAFDRPVAIPPGALTLTDSNGNTMPVQRLYFNDPSFAVFGSTRALVPDTTYTFSLANATDLSGNLLGGPASATFTTGEVLDTTSPAGSYAFISPLPTNMPLRVRFTEPLSPATVLPGRFQLVLGTTAQPATVSLSSDGMTVTIAPQQPLIPGKTYTLKITPPMDFAGNSATVSAGSAATILAASSPVTGPPVVTIFPTDGTKGVPVNIQATNLYSPLVRVSFSPDADVVSSPPVLQVLQNGNPVAGTITVATNGMTFTPSSLFQYSTTYQIVVSGVVDYVGNIAPTVTATFTTSDSAVSDRARFSVVSIQPADGSAGIDNSAPIVISFTKMIDPGLAYFQVISSTPWPVNGRFTVSGSTLTFTPAQPWPSGATITVNIGPQYYGPFGGNFHDLAGIILDKYYSSTFRAAVVPNPVPPALISITPADGTPLSPISTTFTLLFNEPVIVRSQGVQAFNGSTPTGATAYYGTSSSNTIALTVFPILPDSVLTIFGTNVIQDVNGNSITPFSFSYPTLHSDQSGPPAISSISPNEYGSNVQANTPIKITFNKPMDPSSLMNSVIVTQNGALFAGQLQVIDSNQSVQFTPDAPYLPGARIDVFVLTSATDAGGTPLSPQYQSSFFVASGQSAAPQMMTAVFAGFGEAVDPNAGLDVAFDHDLDPASVNDTNVWLRVGDTRIAGTVSRSENRVLRFLPAAPLTIGEQYVLTAGPGLRSMEGLANQPREFRFRAELAEPVRVESVEYLRGPAPLAIRIRFSGPVSPISSGALQLLASDGTEVPATIRPSTDGREWLALCTAPQPVSVVLRGVHDQWGRLLPREERRPAGAR